MNSMKYIATLMMAIGLAAPLQAQSADSGLLSGDLLFEYVFIGIALVLLIIILLLSRVYGKLMGFKAAQNQEKQANSLLLFGVGMTPLLQVTANMSNVSFYFIVGVIVLELFVIFFLVSNIAKLLQSQSELKSEAAKADASGPVIGAFLTDLWYRMNKSVAIEREKDIIRHHEYDGIRELDNDLPPWWVWGFYITIIFSVIYLWRYHVSNTAPLQDEELQIELVRAEERIKAYRASSVNLIDESNVTFVSDEGWIEKGKQVYTQNCVACHGALGEGGVGPNLTDDYWIHGADIASIFKTIKYGVVEKGMTPWKDLISPTQMAQVSSYIKTLRGTNPPNGKDPQGVLVKEEATDEGPAESEGEDENGNSSEL
jgi:mono/diheme cytochrome c family protein